MISMQDPKGPLAQLVEQWTFNPLVEGSNPSRPTIFFVVHTTLQITHLDPKKRNHL